MHSTFKISKIFNRKVEQMILNDNLILWYFWVPLFQYHLLSLLYMLSCKWNVGFLHILIILSYLAWKLWLMKFTFIFILDLKQCIIHWKFSKFSTEKFNKLFWMITTFCEIFFKSSTFSISLTEFTIYIKLFKIKLLVFFHIPIILTSLESCG